MSFPTSNPFRFATNKLNWTLPTAARIVSGYLGGDPVPAGEHDTLYGILTDWVTWIAGGVSDDLLYPVGFADWQVIQDAGALLYSNAVSAPFTGTDPINATVTLKNLSANFLKFRTTVRLKPGKISSATVLVTATTFDDCTLKLFVYSDTGGLLGTFSNTSVSIGTMTLSGSAVELDHASYGIFEVMIGESANDLVTISRLAVKWSAP